MALLTTIPGIAWILGYTIAAEIGDIARFAAPKKLIGYTGLTPKVIQSGESDRRGPLTKNGPRDLRWADIEAAQHAWRYPPYRQLYARTKQRLGRNRGAKVAAITRRPAPGRGDLVDADPQPALVTRQGRNREMSSAPPRSRTTATISPH